MIKKLKTEQCEVTELSKKTKIATDSNEKLQQLSLNYQTLKKEKEHLEELYTKINGQSHKVIHTNIFFIERNCENIVEITLVFFKQNMRCLKSS